MRADRPWSGRVYGVLLIITAAYLVAVGLLTLRPQQPPRGETGPVWQLVHLLRHVPGAQHVPFHGVEFAANIVLFAPFGVLGVLLLGPRRWWVVALAAAAVSVIIETAQRWIPARVSDPRDVVANTLGALVGIVCARLGWSRLRPRHPSDEQTSDEQTGDEAGPAIGDPPPAGHSKEER